MRRDGLSRLACPEFLRSVDVVEYHPAAPGDDAARAALPARAAHACLAQASVWPWVGDRIYEWYDELF